MKEKIYEYLKQELYPTISCDYCKYFDTMPKRPPCNRCHGGDMYKFSKNHDKDLRRMAKEICKLVKGGR